MYQTHGVKLTVIFTLQLIFLNTLRIDVFPYTHLMILFGSHFYVVRCELNIRYAMKAANER